MNRLQRSTINMLSSATGFVVPMLVNVIATPLLLGLLGEESYGLQSLVAVICGYLMVIEGSLDLPITKLLAEYRVKNDLRSENRMLSTTLQLYLFIGLIGMAVISLSAGWLAESIFKVSPQLLPEAKAVFQLAGVGFLGNMGLTWGRALAMGLQRFDISYGVSIVLNLAGVALGLLLVYHGHGVVGYVSARVFVSLASGPLYYLAARRLLPSFHLKLGIDLATLRSVGNYVGYGAFNRIIGSLVNRLDQTLISIWLGLTAAGVYSVAILAVGSLGSMIGYMLGFIFPMASELQGANEMDRLRNIFIRASKFSAALCCMVFIPFLTLSDLLFELWVPSIAEQSRGLLQLLTLSGYLGTMCVSLAHGVVVGTGHIRQFTVYLTIRSVVLAVSCFTMISALGLTGAGWALLITVIVDVCYLRFTLREYLELQPTKLFLTAYFVPITLGAVVGLLLYFARPIAHSWSGLISVIIVGEFLYVYIGFQVGIFGETERRALSGFLKVVHSRLGNRS